MLDIDLNQLDEVVATDSKMAVEEVAVNDIAIIGIAVNMPLAGGLHQFWDNLKAGVDCVTDFPEPRRAGVDPYLRINGGLSGNFELKYNPGAYLSEIDRFDYQFFRLSPKEASLMDPNQRLFLQTAWQCFEDAGYGGENIVGSNTGIYLGYNNDTLYNYRHMVLQTEPESLNVAIPGNLSSVVASRIAYLLDLHGPCICVDTACSASLVAVHLACQGLRSGDCRMALVGGVKISLFPVVLQEKLGIESSDGRTKTFDDNSDGTGMGEGVAAVLLKPLYAAVKDRDHIYAVIKGSAVNQDGNSQGITAPNVVAQEEVILAAWRNAGVDPETITYIEAHGTGTKLGDPIEVEAINRAFRRFTTKRKICAIGAVKTNIGHLDSAAGITGLIKGALSLKYGLLPPILHFNTPNRQIDFESGAVYVNQKLTEWAAQEGPRRCGVSAFGLSGTNCHVILEEAPIHQTPPACTSSGTPQKRMLAISAGQASSLKELLQRYQDFIRLEKDLNMDDLSFTANTGRCHFQHRLWFMVDDLADLKRKINDLSGMDFTKSHPDWFYYGEHRVITGPKEKLGDTEISSETWQDLTDQAMSKLREFVAGGGKDENLLRETGQLYVRGAKVAWEELYRNESRRRISLPVYPFAPTRCWLDTPRIAGGGFQEFVTALNHGAISGTLAAELQTVIQKWHTERDLSHNAETAFTEASVQPTGRPGGVYSRDEQEMAQIWCKVLGLHEINIYDDFYELGGDSILAMKLTNAICPRTGIKIEVTDVLRNSTLESLARCLAEKRQALSAAVDNYQSIQPQPQRDYYLVTAEQKRLFVASQLAATGISFNMPGVLTIEGPFDPEMLQQAFVKLIQRHDTLRTCFEVRDGEPVQIIKDSVPFKMAYGELQDGELPGEITRFIQPFDLKEAPLLRVKLIRQAPGLHYLLFDMHHIISDGTSMGILIKDLLSYFGGKDLTPLAVQYKDFAIWQNQLPDSESIKKQEAYWVSTFQGGPPALNIPCDFPRLPVRSFEGARILFQADAGLTGGLNQLALRTKSTLFMVLLAAYYTLLFRYTGQEDITVGTPVAGRPNADLEKLIGMFVKILLMRNHPRGDQSFTVFLTEVKDTAYQVYDNQDYNIVDLADRLELATDPGRNKLYDTVFLMQNMEIPVISLAGVKFSAYEFDPGTSRNDLVLQAVETDETIEFTLEYCTKLFKPETAGRIGQDYLQILQTIIRDPEIRLSEIRLAGDVVKLQSAAADEVEFSF